MQKKIFWVFLLLMLYCAISFLTNILGSLLPAAIKSFQIPLTMAGALPFVFFIAYAMVSLPAGYLADLYGVKPIMASGILLVISGCIWFVIIPTLWIYLIALFLMGMGVALIMVSSNPLLCQSFGGVNFTFFSVLLQMVFASGSFAAPYVYTYCIKNISAILKHVLWIIPFVNFNILWAFFYLFAGLIFSGLLLLVLSSNFPPVDFDLNLETSKIRILISLLRSKKVWLYWCGVFAYLGVEQGVSVWISPFLLIYCAADPITIGAHISAFFWGGQALGCLVGLFLLKILDQRIVLVVHVAMALLILSIALFGSHSVSLWAFPAFGFCTSVMAPIIFALALNSFKSDHGTLSGIFCSAIAGGAIVPFLEGVIGNIWGLKYGMCLVYICLIYILFIPFFSAPLINNRTIFTN